MNEHELRLIVREAVARHLGAPATSPSPHLPISASPSSIPHPPSSIHSSHSLYAGLVNVSEACVIEPAVQCDHCGYCKSHGH
jgi:hypothetical protein